LAFLAAVCVAGAVALIGASTAAMADGSVLYVAPTGAAGNSGESCGQATYSTIADAVGAAPSGGTVVVCHGTYHEDVLVQKPLRLIGHAARIDASGLENAIHVVSSSVTIRGFWLVHANGEGLLVGVDTPADFGLLPADPVLTNENIEHVHAVENDLGFNGTEQANCDYGFDCGGGIHLNVVEHSLVGESVVNDNSDGILLTDDYGPNAHNVVEDNVVDNNKTECGIVLPSHSSTAVSYVTNSDGSLTVTGRNPDQGGVYDNVVRGNVAVGNGTAPPPAEFGGVGGSGSGIGIFGSGPGSAAYDNVIEDNYVAANGLAGVAIHAHHPGGEDVNGNTIIRNRFGRNNLGGDTFDGGVSDMQTTAVAVYSVPQVNMTIRGNLFRHDAIGVWLTDTVKAHGLAHNSYRHIGTPVVTAPAN
jgi:hypothetical protein